MNERNLLANTYFQKKRDLPNKSKLHIVQLHVVQKYRSTRTSLEYFARAMFLRFNFYNIVKNFIV